MYENTRRGSCDAALTLEKQKTEKDHKTNRITIINITKSFDETAAAHMSRNGWRERDEPYDEETAAAAP